jgi:hypothetical protein
MDDPFYPEDKGGIGDPTNPDTWWGIYDPNLLGYTIRPGCPGVNKRNTVISYLSTDKCKSYLKTDLNASYLSYCGHVANTNLAPTTLPGDKKCGNINSIQDSNLISILQRTHYRCLHFSEFYTLNSSSSRARCNNKITWSETPVVKFYSSCHHNKRGIFDFSNKWWCRKIYSTIDHLINNGNSNLIKGYNHFCYTSPIDLTGRSLCHVIFTTIPNVVTIPNIGNCKLTEIKIFDGTGKRFCNELKFTTSLPISFGTKSGDQNRCKTSSQLTDKTGTVLCRVVPLVSSSFGYSVHSSKINCKITETTINAGKIFKCGGDNTASVTNLQFGRLWGGREPYPGIRSSGRLNGRMKF